MVAKKFKLCTLTDSHRFTQKQCTMKIMAKYIPLLVLPPDIGGTYWLDNTDDVPLKNGIDVKLIQTIAEKWNICPKFR